MGFSLEGKGQWCSLSGDLELKSESLFNGSRLGGRDDDGNGAGMTRVSGLDDDSNGAGMTRVRGWDDDSAGPG
jgi:hypothetical protein